MDQTILENDHVVLMKSFDSGNMKIVQVQRNSIVHYGKLHFDPSPVIGAQYGDIYEIKDGSMFKLDDFEAFEDELCKMMSDKMTRLHEKTKFSQEKILKKKKKKSHANIVTLGRPTLLLINEMLYARDKIGGIRADILSQILTSSNMGNGSKCLVLDHNLGMISSAVLSRVLPDGICIQLLPDYEALQTTRKTVKMLNLIRPDTTENLLSISIRDLYKVHKNVDSFETEGKLLQDRNKTHLERLAKLVKESQCDKHKRFKPDEPNDSFTDNSDPEQLHQTIVRKELNRELRQNERIAAAKILKANQLDSIIIVVQNDHPLHILKLAYNFLAPSRNFVIYSDTVEPLLQCYQYLRTNCLAVSLNISESWLRKYQVLPDRTRPEMNVSGYGGYLLSGTKATYGLVETACVEKYA